MMSVIAIAILCFIASAESIPAFNAKCHCVARIGLFNAIDASHMFCGYFEDDLPQFDSCTAEGLNDCESYCVDKFDQVTQFKLTVAPKVTGGGDIPLGQLFCNILGWNAEDDVVGVASILRCPPPESNIMHTQHERYKSFDEKLTCKDGKFVV